jgi:methionyl-tRNA formyltransferase
MDISIVCSSEEHPVFENLGEWLDSKSKDHRVSLVTKLDALTHGDILFLVSCVEKVGEDIRSNFGATLVLHASDLPKGRGWSPHIWQILENKNEIVVSLLEAENEIDSGRIWQQATVMLDGHELYDEINEKLFDAELALMDFAVENFGAVSPAAQKDIPPSYYRKRTPEDSRVDPAETVEQNFNLLRVSDPDRFPAYFDHLGQRYKIKVEKVCGDG